MALDEELQGLLRSFNQYWMKQEVSLIMLSNTLAHIIHRTFSIVQQDINRGTSAAMGAKIRSLQHQFDEYEKEQTHRTLIGCRSQRGSPSSLSEKIITLSKYFFINVI